MGALADYVEKEFGVETRYNPNPLTTSYTTSVAQIWRNNPDRLMLSIVNMSEFSLFVWTDSSVSSTKGYVLDSEGSSMVLLASEDGEMVGYPIFVVGSGSGSLVSVEMEAT